MPDTVVGLFRSRTEADRALGKLKDAGFDPDQVTVTAPRAGRHGHYGRKLLVGLLAGIAVGALAGALATGMVPGVKPLVSGNLLVTFLFAAVAGAATGLVAGLLISMAASGDRALYYEQEVESGRILLSVSGPRLDEASEILGASGAMESAPIDAPIERPRPEGG